MIDLLALKNNDGMTLRNGKPITYKTGYQVGLSGIETSDLNKAKEAVQAYNGNCGIWFSDGIYYIDNSVHISSKHAAVDTGKACKQISILKWSDMSLIYL